MFDVYLITDKDMTNNEKIISKLESKVSSYNDAALNARNQGNEEVANLLQQTAFDLSSIRDEIEGTHTGKDQDSIDPKKQAEQEAKAAGANTSASSSSANSSNKK